MAIEPARVRKDGWVERLAYLGILVFVLIGCLWLEVVLRTHVLRRWRRLLLSLLAPLIVFFLWDVYAISSRHWWFDEGRILGWRLPGSVPIDEVLFFLVIPLAAILTLEAVRSVRGWSVGDEPSPQSSKSPS